MAEFSHCCVRRLRGKHKQNSDSKTVKAFVAECIAL